ncbi:MAG: hypothetical protein K9M45_10330 [Kiritimatiellales bacterium]|nr:hypothetical protein [Kiritimatiellales bacterium]
MIRSGFMMLIMLCLGLDVQAEKLRILFIGNSYTYVQNMPEILRQMADDKGHELEIEQETPGGKNFEFHWNAGRAAEKMRTGNFDVVVFQNQSFEPVGDPDNMMEYGKLLAAEADKAGARKLFYLTMAYKDKVKWMNGDSDEAKRGVALLPEMLGRLTASYSKLARSTKSEVAPVGIAWKQAYDAVPGIELHRSDNSHPSETGAYLTALVFYATIYGEKPDGMPGTITVSTKRKGKTQETVIEVDNKTRQALEQIAWKTCREFNL